MKHYNGMSEDQVRILNLEARMHLAEARMNAFYRMTIGCLKSQGLEKIQGVTPDIYVQQESERILQETLRGLADHDPVHANQLAAFLADIKKASQKDTP